MKKKALITGITGQDGSYLAELLLQKGYDVHGLLRRNSTFNTQRIDHILQDIHESDVHIWRHYGDLANSESLYKIIYELQPDEVYNLAAQSYVWASFEIPEYTADITGLGTLRVLEVIRNFEAHNPGKKIKLYQASSSEMFGGAPAPQSEKTHFEPRSPYACAKAFAFNAVKNYRDAYGIFASNGILFNHESPRRGGTFVTKKISNGVAAIANGKAEKLYLGNLDAKRDWGFAPEYVEAMWRMLQKETPDDYVIATGEVHSVREFVEEAFRCIGIDIAWSGHGVEEKGHDAKTGKTVIAIDPVYFRPTEVHVLMGDPAKAKEKLGWEPKTKFKDLVRIMVDADMQAKNA